MSRLASFACCKEASASRCRRSQTASLLATSARSASFVATSASATRTRIVWRAKASRWRLVQSSFSATKLSLLCPYSSAPFLAISLRRHSFSDFLSANESGGGDGKGTGTAHVGAISGGWSDGLSRKHSHKRSCATREGVCQSPIVKPIPGSGVATVESRANAPPGISARG